ncbi:DUF6232 family protein [Streptomyces sp. NPDC059875]|uniref:DUF6232 family protein n=1 Tax=unclassified Streptomyces TaxID=2593676 RepID=UPI00365C4A8D
MARRKVTVVELSKRVLWVGAEAYPLNNIARATTVRVRPERAKAVGRFLKSVVVLAVVVAGAVFALQEVELSGSDREEYEHGVLITAYVLLGIFLLQLLSVLLTRTYYALVIETAGPPRTALVTTDQALVQGLVRQIMAAIDNPQAYFKQNVTNYYGQVGDNFKVFGRGNTGKVGN